MVKTCIFKTTNLENLQKCLGNTMKNFKVVGQIVLEVKLFSQKKKTSVVRKIGLGLQ